MYTLNDVTAKLFIKENIEALINSKITVEVENEQVVSIDQLVLQQAGVFEGSYVDIRELVVDANNIEIQNGRVKEAIILTHNVTEKSRINHMLAEELIVLSPTTASKPEEQPRLILDFYESNIKTVNVLKENVDIYLDSFAAIYTINIMGTGTTLNAAHINIGPIVFVSGDIETVAINAPLHSLHFSSTKEAVITGTGQVDNVYIKTAPIVTIELQKRIKGIDTKTRNIILGENVVVGWVSPSPHDAIINVNDVLHNIEEYWGNQ